MWLHGGDLASTIPAHQLELESGENVSLVQRYLCLSSLEIRWFIIAAGEVFSTLWLWLSIGRVGQRRTTESDRFAASPTCLDTRLQIRLSFPQLNSIHRLH